MRKKYEAFIAMGAVIAALGFMGPALASAATTAGYSITPPAGANAEEFREGPGADHRPGVFGRGWGNGRQNGSRPSIIQGNGEPIVGGSVTAISGTTFTLTNKGNTTYSVDASNATVQKGHATSTVSAIVVGDTVIVQGTVNGASITASSVIDSGAAPAANTNARASGKAHGIFGFFQGIGGLLAHLFGF